jgi:hypothetical protein
LPYPKGSATTKVNMGVMLMKAHANVAVVYRSPTKNSHRVSEALHMHVNITKKADRLAAQLKINQ